MLTPFSLPRTWLAHHDESVANPPPARARPTLNPLRISGLQPCPRSTSALAGSIAKADSLLSANFGPRT